MSKLDAYCRQKDWPVIAMASNACAAQTENHEHVKKRTPK